MSFFDIQRTSIYLKVDANAKIIRPLSQKTTGRWAHLVPSCTVIKDNKKTTIRQFKMVDADISRFMKENPDPLWDVLDNDDKFNQKGERVDFPLRPQHIMPVWSYADNDVKIIKQGNQFFEEMVKYYDQGGDVTTCDWACWSEGSGRRGTKYKTSRRDTSPFNCSVPREVLAQKVQAMMDQAINDLRPFKTEDALIRYLSGMQDESGSNSLNAGAPPPQQLPAPAQQPYMPGGPNQMAHGMPGITMSSQQAPQPQMPSYYPQAQAQIQQPYVPQIPQTQPQVYVPQAPQMQSQAPQMQPQVPQMQPQVPQMQSPQVYTPQAPYMPQAPQQQVEIPNAPIASAPVFAPPPPPPVQVPVQQSFQVSEPQVQQPPFQVAAPTNSGAAADFLINFGKHNGKTLGWIKDNDPTYLVFLRGNKKDLAPLIDQLMGGNMQVSISPPPAPQAAQPQPVPENDEQRSRLIKEVNQKIMSIPEFQGAGIHQRMMPFLQSTIGTANFTDAPMDKLLVLKAAVDQKMGAISG